MVFAAVACVLAGVAVIALPLGSGYSSELEAELAAADAECDEVNGDSSAAVRQQAPPNSYQCDIYTETSSGVAGVWILTPERGAECWFARELVLRESGAQFAATPRTASNCADA